MSEPVVPIAVGVSAVVVALIGVEPQVLFWALVGCGLGSPITPKNGLFRSVVTFVMAMLASALLGTLMAVEMLPDATPARVALATKGFSLVLGLAFQPLMSTIIGSIPSIWDGILKRIGVKP